MAKTKAVDTKRLMSACSDFSKLYNVDLSMTEGKVDKEKAEAKLIEVILEETNKYKVEKAQHFTN